MAKVEGQSSKNRDRWIGWAIQIAAGLFLAGGIAISIPARWHAREDARRIYCRNNLKHIALALLNYESQYGCFPPAYTVDAAGRPMHSWRMLILPFIAAGPLYSSCNLDVAWDHPANTTVANFPYGKYLCPSDLDPPDRAMMTNYVMARGPGQFFDPARDHLTRLDDLTDGAADTIMVVETTKRVRWAAPDDPITVAPPDSHHPGGTNVLFADGSVQFWKSTKPAATFRAALTIAGGEVVPTDEP